MTEKVRDLVTLAAIVDDVYDQNCYVLRRRDTDAALVVDPGLQVDAVLAHLEREGLRCERILLTHGHPDHVAGVPRLRREHGAEAFLHPGDRPILASLHFLPGVPDDLPDVEIDGDLVPGAVVEWQGVHLGILHTPGHTAGSVCFLAGTDLLAGDTLFHRGIGRTDLPGGDTAALVASLREVVYALPPDTVVYPGHGTTTTVGEEMQFNPFVVHPRYR